MPNEETKVNSHPVPQMALNHQMIGLPIWYWPTQQDHDLKGWPNGPIPGQILGTTPDGKQYLQLAVGPIVDTVVAEQSVVREPDEGKWTVPAWFRR